MPPLGMKPTTVRLPLTSFPSFLNSRHVRTPEIAGSRWQLARVISATNCYGLVAILDNKSPY